MIVNTYLTADGHFDHQEIKIYDPGSSQPRIYDDYVLAELTQQMLVQNLPKVAGSVALLIAITLCEPLDWGVTIYGWTQGDFSFWDMIGLFPGISAQVVEKVSDGAKVVMNVVRNSECAEVVMRVFRAGDGYVDDAAGGISEAKRLVNAAEGAAKTDLARKLGNEGESAAGIINAKQRIPSLSGTAKYRIPDELLKDKKILREIKNVNSQSYTNQLRDFNEWAKQNGYQFILEVRPGAKLSKPLQEAINNGDIILKNIGQ